MKCSMNRSVILLEHAKEIVEKALEKRFKKIELIYGMQFGLMPDEDTIDAFFILWRIQQKIFSYTKYDGYVLVDLEI